jgi:hypothetical protein
LGISIGTSASILGAKTETRVEYLGSRLIRAFKAEQALDEIVAFDQEFGLL